MKGTVEKIVAYAIAVAEPEMVILFGSIASGTNNIYSDIDLLLVRENHYNRQHFSRQVEAFAREFGLAADVLVHTREEIMKAALQPLSFLGSIINTGKIMYEKT